MQRQYYIFQKNKVLHRRDEPGPRPLSTSEKESLASAASFFPPQGIAMAPNVLALELAEKTPLPPPYHLVPLRQLVGLADDALFRAWGRAAQLLHWRRTSRYCGSCASPTEPQRQELVVVCPACGLHRYPAIYPCIIVLIHRQEEILLARAGRYANNMYSTLAGFIEAGESAEEALQREVLEEVGLRVDGIHYHTSQPWPFPGQLMLGYYARHCAGDIRIDNDEIVDARWFTRDTLPQIPGPGTIAGQLIRHHLRRTEE